MTFFKNSSSNVSAFIKSGRYVKQIYCAFISLINIVQTQEAVTTPVLKRWGQHRPGQIGYMGGASERRLGPDLIEN